jgi:hypothetical protein
MCIKYEGTDENVGRKKVEVQHFHIPATILTYDDGYISWNS